MKIKNVLLFQGYYYVATGIWPVVDIHSFLQVTGYKTDIWLVKMVGLLTLSIGITILAGTRFVQQLIIILAVSSAASYLFIDVYYYFAGVIPKVYLADAAIELVIIFLILARREGRTAGNIVHRK
jgi:hypothetical protein